MKNISLKYNVLQIIFKKYFAISKNVCTFALSKNKKNPTRHKFRRSLMSAFFVSKNLLISFGNEKAFLDKGNGNVYNIFCILIYKLQ